jgi:predicted ATP-grasp superfamily ATP-dependent carboligase
VNSRPWIFVEFAARCGLDVCTMAYRDALGREVATVDTYETGRTLVHPYYDAHACLALYRRGELSPARALKSWMGADMPTVARDDPAPALWSGARLVAGFLGRRIPGWPRGRT